MSSQSSQNVTPSCEFGLIFLDFVSRTVEEVLELVLSELNPILPRIYQPIPSKTLS